MQCIIFNSFRYFVTLLLSVPTFSIPVANCKVGIIILDEISLIDAVLPTLV